MDQYQPGKSKNAITVDVEDYFHVSAFESRISRSDWNRYPLRVETNTRHIMDVFDEFNTKGTFFVLGWVAEKCRDLVLEIQERGHEVGCHGYAHELIYRIGPDRFRQDIHKARTLLEDICGKKIAGYRAPSFSITERSLWALDILLEEGFLYDSSIFPIRHDLYGMRNAELFPHRVTREKGAIMEFPLSIFRVKFFRKTVHLPIAGGGYLRLLPLWLLKHGIDHINRVERQPAVLYFHPWELDPRQPRVKSSLKSRIRHYQNLEKTEGKIRNLIAAFRFAPMGDVLGVHPLDAE